MEEEEGRAAIWEIDPRDRRARASSPRACATPTAWPGSRQTGALWTAVNERDELGSDLVPDYMTSVRDGGFYGWPYSYFGQHVDARVKPPRPDLVAKAIVPDYALGPHTASLGLAFSEAPALPPRYRDGAFIGQHGSWNRKPPSGYKVIFVPFADGRPAGPADRRADRLPRCAKARRCGRPGRRGGRRQAAALLVADDVGNVVWRVTPAGS